MPPVKLEGEHLVDILRRAGIPVKLEKSILGLNQRTAAGLIPPTRFAITESASIWYPRTFSRPVYIWCPAGSRIIRYVPDKVREGGAATITDGLYYSSASGLVRILAPGKYWFNTPIVTAEGTIVNLVYVDAMLDQGVTPEDIVGEPAGLPAAPGSTPDAPLVWATSAQLTVNAADVEVFAANTSRRALSLFNASTGGQRIAITTQDPATAVTRGFVFLDPGRGVYLDSKVPTGAISAWGSAASGLLNRAEAT